MKLTRNGETNGSNRSRDHEIWIVFFKVMYVLMNLQIYNYLLVKNKQKLQTVRFTTHLISLGKIGPQCVLWVLCLILFLSVGMLFSNISIWELTRYKWKGRKVITTFKDRTENIWQNLGKALLYLNVYVAVCAQGYRLFCVMYMPLFGLVQGDHGFDSPYMDLISCRYI